MASPVFGVIAPHPPIFVPEVGGARADVAHASLAALDRARIALARFVPETLIVMSPHAPALCDAFCVDDSPEFSGTLSQFGDATLRVYAGDPELGRAIADAIASSGHAVAMRSEDGRLRSGWLDHATIVPLSFLDPHRQCRLVVLSLSELDYHAHRDAGAAVRAAAESIKRRVAFIASGDMSHRLTPDSAAGYSPRGRELDAQITGLVEQGRIEGLTHLAPDLVEAGGECGLRSIIALGGFCCEDPAPARLLAYEGPWGVGYLTALVGRAALDSDGAAACEQQGAGVKGGQPGSDESEIVALARSTIEAFVRDETAPVAVTPLSKGEYPAKAGTFVSLHRGGELRGCIGTILPTKATLGDEVAANAVEAAAHDPRFEPVTADELPVLEISVDVLHAPESCEFEDLDPKTYGVIVTSGWRRGLLLPDLPGIDDAESQVVTAMRKAGIGSGEPCSLERFRVDRYT